MSTVRPTSSVQDDTMPQRVIRLNPSRQQKTDAHLIRLSELLTWSYVRAGKVGEVLQWAHRSTSRAGRLVIGRRRSPLDGELDPLIDVAAPSADFATLEVLGARTLLRSGRGAPEVRLTLNGACLVRGLTRRELPLQDLWLDSADPVHGQLGPRKAPDTIWDAVVSGTDTALQVRGPWLHIAALGMLAGWAEPA